MAPPNERERLEQAPVVLARQRARRVDEEAFALAVAGGEHLVIEPEWIGRTRASGIS